MKTTSFKSLNGTTWVVSEGFCVLGYFKSKAEASAYLDAELAHVRERGERLPHQRVPEQFVEADLKTGLPVAEDFQVETPGVVMPAPVMDEGAEAVVPGVKLSP